MIATVVRPRVGKWAAGALLVVLNILDLSITYFALRRGGREANPVMAFVLARPWLAWWLKAVAPTVIAVRAVRDPRRLASYGIWIAAALCSVVVGWNVVQLISQGLI